MTHKIHILFDRLYRIVSEAVFLLICGLTVLFCFGLIPVILNHFEVWNTDFGKQYFACMKPVLVVLGIILLALIIVIIILLPFTSAEADERAADGIASPLLGLTRAQKKSVIRLIREKGKPQEGSQQMKRAEVAYILNALIEMGYINNRTDSETLRLWVIQITGYQDNDRAHFAEALGRCRKNDKSRLTKDLIVERLTSASVKKSPFYPFCQISHQSQDKICN